jgi:hypothetical protein
VANSALALVRDDAALRVRKERIHTTMLIELLALLVFLAMAFAFVMKEEGDRLNPWKAKYDQAIAERDAALRQVRELRREVRTLKLKTEQLEAFVRQLLAAHEGPLAANDRLAPISRAQYERLMAQNANSDALLEQLQRENAELRARIAAKGGGASLPACLVTPGYLLHVDMLGDGRFVVRPAWSSDAAAKVAEVPGVAALVGGPMSREAFLSRTQAVSRWGRAQAVPCVFRVTARSAYDHDIELYKRQLSTVEQHFYVARR